ncbi:MAG TPA: hypothetical protein VFG12_02705 [Rhodopila sp.]|nr:hypothetical protein [Rhodopila sp.]
MRATARTIKPRVFPGRLAVRVTVGAPAFRGTAGALAFRGMAGLGPAIHEFASASHRQDVATGRGHQQIAMVTQ